MASPVRYRLSICARMAGRIDDGFHDASDAGLSASEDGDGVDLVPPNPGPWGKPFPVEWIITTALPFRLVRHLHNPWNSNV